MFGSGIGRLGMWRREERVGCRWYRGSVRWDSLKQMKVPSTRSLAWLTAVVCFGALPVSAALGLRYRFSPARGGPTRRVTGTPSRPPSSTVAIPPDSCSTSSGRLGVARRRLGLGRPSGLARTRMSPKAPSNQPGSCCSSWGHAGAGVPMTRSSGTSPSTGNTSTRTSTSTPAPGLTIPPARPGVDDTRMGWCYDELSSPWAARHWLSI
jgi:hypothetical protein